MQPKINLNFNSKFQTQFKIVVNYDLIKFSLIANAKHCNGRIKLNQLDSASINFSLNLGIGLNRIVFHVINDLNNDHARTYQLIIKRLSLDEVSTYD